MVLLTSSCSSPQGTVTIDNTIWANCHRASSLYTSVTFLLAVARPLACIVPQPPQHLMLGPNPGRFLVCVAVMAEDQVEICLQLCSRSCPLLAPFRNTTESEPGRPPNLKTLTLPTLYPNYTFQTNLSSLSPQAPDLLLSHLTSVSAFFVTWEIHTQSKGDRENTVFLLSDFLLTRTAFFAVLWAHA